MVWQWVFVDIVKYSQRHKKLEKLQKRRRSGRERDLVKKEKRKKERQKWGGEKEILN